MTRILVLGASGYIGTHLAPRLAQRGHRVRAAARRLDALQARGWRNVELAQANALAPSSLDHALDGVEIAYYLVHSMASGAHFARRDRRAADHFRDACARAGVRRIIYLGGLQPPGSDGVSPHLASRRETGERLRDGPVPVTEIRAGIIVGAGSAAFEVIRDLVYHLPIMLAPRWVRSRSQPIALDDLLEYLVQLADTPDLPDDDAGRIYDAVGPETLSYADLIRQFADIAGKSVRIVPLPVLTPRLSSYWLDLVTSAPASVARPLIDGLRHDLVSADPDALQRLIPIPLHSYRDAARQALADEAADNVPIRWTEGGFRYRRRRHDIAWFDKSEQVSVDSRAPASAVWSHICASGGDHGWHYATWLWRLRGAIDRLVGGVGMRRGRRHPTELRVGDPLDFWRVAAIEPGKRLTLVAEMKLPGSAVLELSVAPQDSGSQVHVSAHFHPAGVWGLLYWYALWPVHRLMFRRLAEALSQPQ